VLLLTIVSHYQAPVVWTGPIPADALAGAVQENAWAFNPVFPGFLVVLGLAGQVWWVWALLRFVPRTDFPP
jgi:hypothetical protein